MTAPREFAYTHLVEATLRDTDGLGHVNNAVYVTWFEEARTSWIAEAMGIRDLRELGFVLASTTIDFRSPVYLREKVAISLVPTRVGDRSWELAYEGRAVDDGRLVVEGTSVQVQYDWRTRRSAPMTDAWRRMLTEGMRG